MPCAPRASLIAALALVLSLVGAPAASAGTAGRRAPEPLVRVAPVGTTEVLDRVLPTSTGTRAFSAASRAGTAYAAADGTHVLVSFSPGYTPDPATAQSYVDFLGSLPHGSELGRLTVLLVPPSEVEADCGGGPGVLACYGGSDHQMIVPGEQIADSAGVSTSYVVAHEYGHHIAAFRSDAPFAALDFGPKYWSSYAGVCSGVLSGRLVPGSESDRYLDNPGESWAEVYARLTFPQEPWRFTPLLAPDAGALAAARRDVVAPWTGPVTRTFRGSFSRGGASYRRFSFSLTLDGALSIALRGPLAASYDVRVTAMGRVQGTTRARGARDAVVFKTACRQRQSERVTLTVLRRAGRGPFTLRATYAG